MYLLYLALTPVGKFGARIQSTRDLQLAAIYGTTLGDDDDDPRLKKCVLS
jgi:hypothetical protein